MSVPSEAFMVPVAIAMLLGAFLFILSGIARLLQGKVEFRPFDAVKQATLLIAIMVPLMLLLRFLIPSNYSAMQSVGFTVFAAIFLSSSFSFPEIDL